MFQLNSEGTHNIVNCVKIFHNIFPQYKMFCVKRNKNFKSINKITSILKISK